MATVFMTGATGYLGRRLSAALVARGDEVLGLVRPGSAGRLAPGVKPIEGDALSASSFAGNVPAGSTFVQLVGVPHPSPAKAEQFRTVDLASVRAAVDAATVAGVAHFVYVSVAQPAPIMRAYQAVRAEGERRIRESGLRATILRPWYVLGPGHRWPLALVPIYWLLEKWPATREGARRLGLVTLDEMVAALAEAVAHPPDAVRVVSVEGIRSARVERPRRAALRTTPGRSVSR
ncbi:MAG: NAD(P)H-binding protein [Vicinamibacterales bacterium]